MQKPITFTSSNSSLNSFKTDLIFCGLYEGEKINKDLGDTVSEAVKIESFKGKYKKKIIVYGDNLKRIIIIGLGKKKDASNLRFREIGAMISNYTNQLSVGHISLDVKSLQ